MIRIVFLLILLFHGLIHFMGYVKSVKPESLPELSLSVNKSAGLLWLLAGLMFTVAVVLFLLRKEAWWMLAAPALVLSQGLIFMAWRDAKFGTIANAIVLIGIALAFASWRFDAMVKNDIAALLPATLQEKQIVTEDMIAPLPPIVQRWLRRTGAVGHELIHTVHLKQTGAMRTDPASEKWIPFTAEQYFTPNPPGFVWVADVQMSPLLPTRGRDKYLDGHGHMLIKVWSLLPVADSKGPAMDQGTMLRYLGEIAWFPTAALSDYLQWEEVDSLTAKATMTYGGVTASMDYHFNEAGDLLSLEAMRYYDRKEGATLERWGIEAEPGTVKEFDGIRFPAKYKVIWKLQEGDYNWLSLEIVEAGYN